MPEEASPDDAPGLVLAFDFGARRIGVACGDTLSHCASPLTTLAAGRAEPLWSGIDALIAAWRPARAVVGLPYNVDDSESAMAPRVREFAKMLEQRYRMPVDLVDERYSSLEAAARLRSARQSGLRRRRVGKEDVDATAACVILERWFTTRT